MNAEVHETQAAHRGGLWWTNAVLAFIGLWAFVVAQPGVTLVFVALMLALTSWRRPAWIAAQLARPELAWLPESVRTASPRKAGFILAGLVLLFAIVDANTLATNRMS